MLGQDLQKALAGRDVTALSRAELDVTDRDAVLAAVAGHDVVINASAYTKVDDAETHEDDGLRDQRARHREPRRSPLREHGARLVTVSTDYVFDGHATRPVRRGHRRGDPINAYGRTKAAGEELALAAHPDGTFVVRTAWLYGAGGPNFATTMVKLAAEPRDGRTSSTTSSGQPTWTGDLAAQIVALLEADAPAGIYHGTNSGETTWYEFARAVFARAGLDPERVKPTDSSSFVRPAAPPVVLGPRSRRLDARGPAADASLGGRPGRRHGRGTLRSAMNPAERGTVHNQRHA